MGGIDTEEAIGGAIAGENHPVVLTGWPLVPLPSVMPRSEGIARKPLGIGPPVVGGTFIGLITEAPEASSYRSRGQRGSDLKPLAKRKCQRCK
jgi:hypothetical protein